MQRLLQALKIRPGEGRTATRLVVLMLIVWAGAAVGSTGAESLLFARFGPQALPWLYVLLGLITLPTMLGMTALLSSETRTLATVLVVLGAVLIPARLALVLDVRLFYPALWLLMMVVWVIQGMALWRVASAVTDTRQAKRLFPLFGAAMILGGAAGGIATGPLSTMIGAENFLVVWAATLVVGFWLARSVLDSASGRGSSGRRRAHSPVKEMVESIRSLRRSRLLVSMAGALTLFAMLYFILSLPFARAVTHRFPDADRLAAFLGLFFGLMNVAALILSLFAVNRLFARFGVATMVLVLPLIYLAGFGVVAVGATFAPLVAFRFIQMVWLYAVWSPGWEALFNVVPSQRRGPIRTLMEAGPRQIGTAAAGVLLLAADRILAPRGLFLVGLAAAALAAGVMWYARKSYGHAVIESLRAGWPDVFVAEEHPFGGVQQDATALRALLDATSAPDPRLRRVALEILSDVPSPEADAALIKALGDPDSNVRDVALKALVNRRTAAPPMDVLPLLEEEDVVARAWAVRALAPSVADQRSLGRFLVPFLADPDPGVRAHAAAALARTNGTQQAQDTLDAMSADARSEWRAMAVEVLESGDAFAARIVDTGLSDSDPSVRRAAAASLGRIQGKGAVDRLIQTLGDPDPAVREAATHSLIEIPEGTAERLAKALNVPAFEQGALLALRSLPLGSPDPLRAYAGRQRDRAQHYHRLWLGLVPDGDERTALAAASVRYRALGHARSALQAAALLGDREAFDVALENLESDDREQVANALETLEGAGEPELVRPLLSLWETGEARGADTTQALREMLHDDDAWLRASAATAAKTAAVATLREAVRTTAASDPDPMVREAAAWTLRGGSDMETVTTLPLMERVLFLERVPLFAGLSPPDVKRVAEVAIERAFQDGDVLAEAGESGDEMHVVVEGAIRVLMPGSNGPTEIALRESGDYVGEMSIISEEPRMASLVAVGSVRTLSIDHKRFERIVWERPQASLAVMRVLCDRLREASRQAAPATSPG